MVADPSKPNTTAGGSLAQRWAQYADAMVREADAMLDRGQHQEAIRGYLKAAEVYLMLADHEERYSSWQQYIGKASMCHQKVKSLIASAGP